MVDDNKPLKDYVVSTNEEQHCSIVHPTLGPNNFKIKPFPEDMMQQNQFIGLLP